MLKMQTHNHHFRLNTKTDGEYILRKMGLKLFQVLSVGQNVDISVQMFCRLVLGVLTHCLWCNVISWAKPLYIFSNDYHDLKWEYSTIKQHGTGR